MRSNKIKILKNYCIPYNSDSEIKSFSFKIKSKEGFYSIAINAEKIIRCYEDKLFSKIVESSAMQS